MPRRVGQTRTTRTRQAPQAAIGRRRLQQLVDDATVDAHDESEQRVGFLTMLDDQLAVPFTTVILGAPVRVERVALDNADQIVAICRRGRQRQQISILNLPRPVPPPAGWEWIEAYRHWARGWR